MSEFLQHTEIFHTAPTQEITHGPSLENAEMYHLPGDPTLTEKDLERYQKENEQIEKRMQETRLDLIRRVFESGNEFHEDFLEVMEQTRYLPEQDRVKFVEQGLNQNSFRSRVLSLAQIPYLPEQDRIRFVEQGLSHIQQNIIRCYAIGQVRFIPEVHRTTFVIQSMKDPDSSVRMVVLEQVQYLPETERTKLIQEGFLDEKNSIRTQAAKQIKFAPIGDRVRLIEQCLEHKDLSLGVEATKQLVFVPEADRLSLMEKSFQHPNQKVWREAVKQVQYLSEEFRKRFVEQAIDNGDTDTGVCAIQQVQFLSEVDRIEKIQECLSSYISDITAVGIEQVFCLPEGDRTKVIEQGLNDFNTEICMIACEQIQFAPAQDREGLMEKALSSRLLNRTWYILEQLHLLSKEAQERIKERFLEKDLKELAKQAATTPLYKDESDRFFHRKFRKTGTGITLLDRVPGKEQKSLRNRVIIRHIPWSAYETWKQAYEAVDVWKELGFDYIPIEPIVGVKESHKPFILDVSTRVLQGPSIHRWGEFYRENIDEQKNRIMQGLEKIGISHGHPHEGNFVVYFDRDEQGKVDITKPPRVYMIDFDQAVSSEKTGESSSS